MIPSILVALLVAPVTPYLVQITQLIRYGIALLFVSTTEQSPDYITLCLKVGLKGLLGVLFCYGSKVGWYHSIYLPLILIEMEYGEPSILGTIDLLSLVLVSAGICFGTLLWRTLPGAQHRNGESDDDDNISLMKRGLYINLLCGDFIEVCYPLMESNIIINIGGYIASGISTMFLAETCKSSAYLPLPISIWLANDMHCITIASIVAFGIAFLFTIIGHIWVDCYAETTSSSTESTTATIDSSSNRKDKQK